MKRIKCPETISMLLSSEKVLDYHLRNWKIFICSNNHLLSLQKTNRWTSEIWMWIKLSKAPENVAGWEECFCLMFSMRKMPSLLQPWVTQPSCVRNRPASSQGSGYCLATQRSWPFLTPPMPGERSHVVLLVLLALGPCWFLSHTFPSGHQELTTTHSNY